MTATALVAADLVLAGKGILCLDESGPALDARLRAAGVPPGASSRLAYLSMLVGTPWLSLGISGVSVNEEAFRMDGVAEAVAGRELLAGVRADTGTRPLAGAPGETATEGLDGLTARLASHAALGARFATWRAVLRAGDGYPSWRALRANASGLAAVRRLGAPWPVTFAFGRALTGPALAAWHGDPSCVATGQRALANRVACNIAALQGRYTPVLEPGYVLAPVGLATR